MDTAGSSTLNGRHQTASNTPILVLEPINDTFILKSLELPDQVKVKIGRQTGVTTAPHPSNGYFDSKVLSRVHAEVWSEAGKVYIRDLKSSNGTFLNGKRLCHENTESEPFELNQNDGLEFGIDIMDENGACKLLFSSHPC
jgi:pSer/pThr/pTyr-binding forkhead associated (FHA) protein